MLGFLDRKRNSSVATETPARVQTILNTPDGSCSEDDEVVVTAQAASGSNGARAQHAIRLVPIMDHNTSFPVKYVKTVQRNLDEDGIFRLGRIECSHPQYKDLEPIVFRSKVVSRIHAELILENGKWYIRDASSSSGTFLNSTRLSPSNQPSTNKLLKDHDTLQLGLNFRGGTQESFQCVKMRVLLDYSWKRSVTAYNTERHEDLRKAVLSGAPLQKFEECSICLFHLEPSQSLFISPCAHGWHYKCIRPLLIKNYPNFHCPNCRGTYDLEDDEDDEE